MLKVDISHRVGDFALTVAFEASAHVTALFGRSGAGKTSLVNSIAGLLRPDQGHIEIDGDVLFDHARRINVPVHKRRIGYVFQEGRLFPHLTVQRNLLYGHDLNAGATQLEQPEHIIKLLGLEQLLGRYPADLSGGEKQRVAIGRALLSNPRLLLLDEPLAALDAQRKDEILRYLRLLRDETRIPMVYVSHAVEEVLRLADQVVLLAAGRVVASGSVEAVMGRPDLGATAGVFEGGSVIEARVESVDTIDDIATLAFDGGTLTVGSFGAQPGEAVRVRIRAREVSIALVPPQQISIQNMLCGRIVAMDEPHGSSVNVTIAVGAATLRSRITKRAARQLALAPGLTVYALIKAVSLDRRGPMA